MTAPIDPQTPVATFLDATSIAIVGASDDGDKASGRTHRYLRRYGFAGAIYPINPQRSEVQGEKAYANVLDLPEVPDVAVIVLPQQRVEQAVIECGRLGISLAIVFAAGYAEVGGEGVRRQEALAAVAHDAGVRLLGPNCVGAVAVRNAATATFMTGLDQNRFDLRDDGIAFVSQSGAMGGFILNMAQSQGLGVGRFFSTGNEADLGLAELVDGLVTEGSTRVALAYVEGIRDGAAFERSLARAQQQGVPVCVMKVGRSERGAQAAASHTGALAGSDKVFDGVLTRYGAQRADDVEHLLDLGRVFAAGRTAAGRKVSIVTLSGGAGALMTDSADDLGLDVFAWDEYWRAKMAAILPDFASVTNPIDTTGAIANNPSMLTDALEVCVANPDTDIAVILLGNLETEEDEICRRIVAVAEGTDKPVLVAWVGGSGRPQKLLSASRVPTFSDPVRAMRAAAALSRWSLAPQFTMDPPVVSPELSVTLAAKALSGVRILDEVSSKELLGGSGLRVTREYQATSPEEATEAAEELGYPVVVKLLSDQVEHKSDVGGVRLDLRDAADVRQATTEIFQIAERLALTDRRVVVQESIPAGTELIVGMAVDPTFGAVTMVGIGGVFAEVLSDVQTRPAPVSAEEARQMIADLGAVALLRGARGRPPADEDAVARQVAGFSAFTAGLAEQVESVDVNPLIIDSAGQPVAVDAVVTLCSVSDGTSDAGQPR